MCIIKIKQNLERKLWTKLKLRIEKILQIIYKQI